MPTTLCVDAIGPSLAARRGNPQLLATSAAPLASITNKVEPIKWREKRLVRKT